MFPETTSVSQRTIQRFKESTSMTPATKEATHFWDSAQIVFGLQRNPELYLKVSTTMGTIGTPYYMIAITENRTLEDEHPR